MSRKVLMDIDHKKVTYWNSGNQHSLEFHDIQDFLEFKSNFDKTIAIYGAVYLDQNAVLKIEKDMVLIAKSAIENNYPYEGQLLVIDGRACIVEAVYEAIMHVSNSVLVRVSV